MYDGSLDSQFNSYPQPQREAIFAFQRRYGAVRVRRIEGSTDIEVEGLDGSQKRRVVATAYVGEDGCHR